MSNSKLVETSISDEQRAKARLLNSPLRLLRSPSITKEMIEAAEEVENQYYNDKNKKWEDWRDNCYKLDLTSPAAQETIELLELMAGRSKCQS